MACISSKFLIPLTYLRLSAKHSRKPFHAGDVRINFRNFALITCSKKSSYPDFQEYAKPSRILPAAEAKPSKNTLVEKLVSSIPSGISECLYIIKFQTSKIYGSGLIDTSSAVSLCLVDENGSSILQRLPAITVRTGTLSEDEVTDDTLHFQQGRVDEFYFEGPKLGKIIAVWISLESGQWRIGGLSLILISHSPDSSAETDQESKQVITGVLYNFDIDDILLDEKSELSMLELRPQSVTAFSGDDIDQIEAKAWPSSPSPNYLMSGEQGMKEYEDLKFSLLFYDAMLILAGSSLASLLAVENAYSYAFFIGGACGFFYLLLLQRSVDGLPSQVLTPNEKEGGFERILGTLKGPISGLVLTFALAIVTVKLASGDDALKLSPKEVIFGMLGFLMCKVSVVLSAFKPMPFRSRNNDGAYE